MENSNRFVKGALLLSLAGFISKILSAGYRVPLQNLMGDLGFYIYQQIYPILGMIMIISLYGFPSAISKITVDLKQRGKGHSLYSFYIPILLILIGICGLISLGLYVGADTIAYWVGDPYLAPHYQATAFVFLMIPLITILRGVTQGNYFMDPTAYSQLGEQIVRVMIIVLAAYLYKIGNIDIYMIGTIAPLASIAGSIVALIILMVYMIKYKLITTDKYNIPWAYYIRILLSLGIVASLNHMVFLLIQFADMLTLVPNLMKYGLTSSEAMEAKGVFDRGQPFIQLGTVLGSSFALALIPTTTSQRDVTSQTFNESIRGGLLLSFYIAIGAVIGLMMIFPEANTLLFQNTKGTASLQILSLSIALTSLSVTITAVLQGLGFYKQTALFIICAFLIKLIANKWFVIKWGISGSAFATVFSLLLLTVILFVQLKRKLPNVNLLKNLNWAILLIASMTMILYLLLIKYLLPYHLIDTRIGLLIYVLFISLSGATIYICLLIRGRAFTKAELQMFPFSSVWIKIHRGRRST